jgi:hypothetical protein
MNKQNPQHQKTINALKFPQGHQQVLAYRNLLDMLAAAEHYRRDNNLDCDFSKAMLSIVDRLVKESQQ